MKWVRLVHVMTVTWVIVTSLTAHAQWLTPPFQEYIAPGNLFYAKVPYGWFPAADPHKPDEVIFQAVQNPAWATLVITRRKVPSGAKSKQLLLDALEQRLVKLPSFKELGRPELTIANRKTFALIGVYAYQGNFEYMRTVEEIYFVNGEEAFIMHFECSEAASRLFAEPLLRFLQSFTPRPQNNPEITPPPPATRPPGKELTF